LGVLVMGSDATIENTVVRDTMADPEVGFGDGVLVVSAPWQPADLPTTAQLRNCRVEGSARAGIASFGATVTLERVTLDCNAIHLNGEEQYAAPVEVISRPFSFVDQGGNACGCEQQAAECTVMSSGLQAPGPVGACGL
jgi:hypothetical protein